MAANNGDDFGTRLGKQVAAFITWAVEHPFPFLVWIAVCIASVQILLHALAAIGVMANLASKDIVFWTYVMGAAWLSRK